MSTGSILSGRTLTAAVLERRETDFTPDAGAIDRPVQVASSAAGVVYILDEDGEVFRVDPG